LEDKRFSKSYTLWFFVKEPELFIGVGAKGVFEFKKKKIILGLEKGLKHNKSRAEGSSLMK
jgi:hypothetical protein